MSLFYRNEDNPQPEQNNMDNSCDNDNASASSPSNSNNPPNAQRQGRQMTREIILANYDFPPNFPPINANP